MIGWIHRVAVFPAASHGAIDDEGVQKWSGPESTCKNFLMLAQPSGMRTEGAGSVWCESRGDPWYQREFYHWQLHPTWTLLRSRERSSHRYLLLRETTWTIAQRVGQRFRANVGIRNLLGDDRCWKRDRWERRIGRPTGYGLREGMKLQSGKSAHRSRKGASECAVGSLTYHDWEHTARFSSWVRVEINCERDGSRSG